MSGDLVTRLCFYQTRSPWSVDQGSNKNHSPAYNFAPTVTKFCVMWEGLSLPHDTKFGNCRCKIVDSRAFPSWSLIHGLRWSGLIKAEPGCPRRWYTCSTTIQCAFYTRPRFWYAYAKGMRYATVHQIPRITPCRILFHLVEVVDSFIMNLVRSAEIYWIA